jgi:integrase
MADTRSYRLPRKRVWVTEKTVERKNGANGRLKMIRRAIVRWRPGRRVRERAFDDLLAAGRFAGEKEEELKGTRGIAAPRDLLFSEWVDAYLGSRFAEYRGPIGETPGKFEDGYLSQLVLAARRLVSVLGDRRLSEYRITDFESIRTEVNCTGALRPTTTESVLARIRTIFRAAWKEGLLDRPPEIRVRDLAYEKPVFEEEEIREIFEAAKRWPRPAPGQVRRFGEITGRLYPIIATLHYTMMRRGEVIHLAWSDGQRFWFAVRLRNQHMLLFPHDLCPCRCGPPRG